MAVSFSIFVFPRFLSVTWLPSALLSVFLNHFPFPSLLVCHHCIPQPLLPAITFHSQVVSAPKMQSVFYEEVFASVVFKAFLVKSLPLLHYPSNILFMFLSPLLQCSLLTWTFSVLILSSLGLVLKSQFPSLWREQLSFRWVPPTPPHTGLSIPLPHKSHLLDLFSFLFLFPRPTQVGPHLS